MSDTSIVMKVTAAKTVGFYMRAAATFLEGTAEKPAVEELTLTALGEAIQTVVTVAARIEKEGLAKVKKVATAYADVPTAGGITRGCAHLRVVLAVPGYWTKVDTAGRALSDIKVNTEKILDLAGTCHLDSPAAACNPALGNSVLSITPAIAANLAPLRIIFLRGNGLKTCPDFSGLSNLFMLGLDNNSLEDLAEGCLPRQLEWLLLTNNQLKALPEDFGSLTRLRKLAVSNNRLSALPKSFSSLEKLEMFRFPCNQLRELDDAVLALPRLAWISLASNDRSLKLLKEPPKRETPLPHVEISAIKKGKRLNGGASGDIYEADVDASLSADALVVKEYKLTQGADGAPEDELKVYTYIMGPYMPQPLATYTCDNGCNGLVMARFDETMKDVAKPPNFRTITRDGQILITMPVPQAVAAAQKIARAMCYLHEKGIAHGDLYNHNIMHSTAKNDTVLYDFGASFFYDREVVGDRIERIEVLAFAHVVEEFLESCGGHAGLAALHKDCAGDAAARPLFKEICTRLDDLTC